MSQEQEKKITAPAGESEREARASLHTSAAILCFLIDTVDLMDQRTRLKIADLLERQVQEDYTITVLTDPSRRLNNADPLRVNNSILNIAESLRIDNPLRESLRREMGFVNP